MTRKKNFHCRVGSTILGMLLLGCQNPSLPEGQQVCFNRNCISVELAYQENDLIKGLQFRPSLPEKHGMLFIFPEHGRFGFWMKDTLIPLDMIWLDDNRRVIDISDNVPPCLKMPCPAYKPRADYLYVLEINGKEAQKLGIHLGDFARFHFEFPAEATYEQSKEVEKKK